MKKDDKKAGGTRHVALTLLVAAMVFCLILVAVVLAGLVVYILFQAGLVPSNEGPAPGPLLFLMMIVSLVLGAGLTAVFSRVTLKPVKKLIDQMNRLAAGDFRARLSFGKPIGSHPTFVEIADSFNKMAGELENTEMLRSDFVNNFSHEFKTPIVSISGFAKLLKHCDLTEGERAEYAGIIEEESLRLAAMATNVLSLTKLENQTILSQVTEYNLSEQLRASILALEGKWEKKNVAFDLDIGEYRISGNKNMLRQVWVNLLDNAIKFSPSGETVKVELRLLGEVYRIIIADHGPGIPEEQRGRIFQKFYQADESHSSEGNGIGLALVKSVVQLHGGQVTVECENGTTSFTVTLPKEQ